MIAAADSTRARRYLLGLATEDECAALEEEYLASDEAVDRLAAVEDELIDEYLGGHLSAADRDRFERGYLAAPGHRLRVEAVRSLQARAAHETSARPEPFAARAARTGSPRPAPRPARKSWFFPVFALAASLVLASGVVWMRSSSGPGGEQAAVAGPAPAAQATPAPGGTPRVLALTLGPAAVRSASDAPAAVIPPGTDIVTIRLERDDDPRPFTASRASIRTVAGAEIWQGAARDAASRGSGALAELDVPAGRLPADDYLVSVTGADGAGAEQQRGPYFLRVRRP